MKILAISDSHGYIQRLNHVVGFANKERFDLIIHCGDWQYPESIKTMEATKIPLYTVLGNADDAQQDVISKELKKIAKGFNPVKLILPLGALGGKKIVIAHKPGALIEEINSGKYDFVFHGHTHKIKNKTFGKTRIVNPGALGKTDKPSFAVCDTNTNSIEFINIAL